MSSQPIILHVEDDPNDVLLVQRAFRKAGVPARIESVEDGDQAVAYLSGTGKFSNRQVHPIPDLVLLDLKMPRKSGFEVLEWIRSREQLRGLLVTIFTSSKHEKDVLRAYSLGANSYLVKPVGFDELVGLAKILSEYWLGLNMRPGLS